MKSVYVKCVMMLLLIVAIVGQQFIRNQLFGNRTTMIYYTSIFVGTPPVEQKLLADTGSSLTNFPCSKCVKCDTSTRLSSLYNQDKSFSSYRVKCRDKKPICKQKCNLNQQFCQYTSTYGDGTQNIGNIIQDKISFSQDSSSFIADFGCNIYQHATNNQAKNGIFGLSPKPSQNILYNWFLEDFSRGREFSICLTIQSGGFIQYGKYPQKIEYNHILKLDFSAQSYILKNAKSFKVGQTEVANQFELKKNVLLDTGTSGIFVSSKLREAMVQQLPKACTGSCQVIQQRKDCFLVPSYSENHDFLKSLDKQFNSIFLEADGKVIVIKPSAYMQKQIIDSSRLPQDTSVICSTIFTISNDRSDKIILGVPFFYNRKITFNLQQKTCSIKQNFNCIFRPYHNIGDDNLQDASYKFQYILSIIKEYDYVIILVAGILVASLMRCAYKRIKIMLKNRRKNNRRKSKKKEGRRGGNGSVEMKKKNKNKSISGSKIDYQQFNDESLKGNEQISENVISEKDESQIQ